MAFVDGAALDCVSTNAQNFNSALIIMPLVEVVKQARLLARAWSLGRAQTQVASSGISVQVEMSRRVNKISPQAQQFLILH